MQFIIIIKRSGAALRPTEPAIQDNLIRIYIEGSASGHRTQYNAFGVPEGAQTPPPARGRGWWKSSWRICYALVDIVDIGRCIIFQYIPSSLPIYACAPHVNTPSHLNKISRMDIAILKWTPYLSPGSGEKINKTQYLRLLTPDFAPRNLSYGTAGGRRVIKRRITLRASLFLVVISLTTASRPSNPPEIDIQNTLIPTIAFLAPQSKHFAAATNHHIFTLRFTPNYKQGPRMQLGLRKCGVKI